MSTNDSGHLEGRYGGQEGSEEAVLVGCGKGVDLCANMCAVGIGSAGRAEVRHEHQSDPQMAMLSQVCAGCRTLTPMVITQDQFVNFRETHLRTNFQMKRARSLSDFADVGRSEKDHYLIKN
ncbi:MAG: hypothetical protein ABJ246_06670 [Paracoccaceae bacterium]